jgi:hypothetical protein
VTVNGAATRAEFRALLGPGATLLERDGSISDPADDRFCLCEIDITGSASLAGRSVIETEEFEYSLT